MLLRNSCNYVHQLRSLGQGVAHAGLHSSRCRVQVETLPGRLHRGKGKTGRWDGEPREPLKEPSSQLQGCCCHYSQCEGV